jgi:hypothetical protein
MLRAKKLFAKWFTGLAKGENTELFLQVLCPQEFRARRRERGNEEFYLAFTKEVWLEIVL